MPGRDCPARTTAPDPEGQKRGSARRSRQKPAAEVARLSPAPWPVSLAG